MLDRQTQALVDWVANRFSKPSSAVLYFRIMATNLEKSHPHRAQVFRRAANYLL